MKLKEMAPQVPQLSFGFVFAMPEGLIVDVWALPEQEKALDVLAKALLELAIWAKASSGLLGEKPPILLLDGGMRVCGCEVEEHRFLMLGFSAEAPLKWIHRRTQHMVDTIRP